MTALLAETRRRSFDRVVAEWAPGRRLPRVLYTEQEDATWRRVVEHLWPLQDRWACEEVLSARDALDLSPHRIPDFNALDRRLGELGGFGLEPVQGLVPARAFFASLERWAFPATLYVRALNSYAYTPEPDVVHELLGHGPTLASRRIAAVSQRFGVVASRASAVLLRQVERAYWHAMEFGVVETPGGLRALGSGLLSSCSELSQIERVQHAPWQVRRMARTAFATDQPQDRLFVAPSFDVALDRVENWLEEVES